VKETPSRPDLLKPIRHALDALGPGSTLRTIQESLATGDPQHFLGAMKDLLQSNSASEAMQAIRQAVVAGQGRDCIPKSLQDDAFFKGDSEQFLAAVMDIVSQPGKGQRFLKAVGEGLSTLIAESSLKVLRESSDLDPGRFRALLQAILKSDQSGEFTRAYLRAVAPGDPRRPLKMLEEEAGVPLPHEITWPVQQQAALNKAMESLGKRTLIVGDVHRNRIEGIQKCLFHADKQGAERARRIAEIVKQSTPAELREYVKILTKSFADLGANIDVAVDKDGNLWVGQRMADFSGALIFDKNGRIRVWENPNVLRMNMAGLKWDPIDGMMWGFSHSLVHSTHPHWWEAP